VSKQQTFHCVRAREMTKGEKTNVTSGVQSGAPSDMPALRCYKAMLSDLSNPAYGRTEYRFSYADVLRILNDAKQIFRKEPTPVECKAPAVVVADLHGQYGDLLRMFSSFDEIRDGKKSAGYRSQRYIFLGDYVDRGMQSTEVIMMLYLLKILYKSQFILLRGNHETAAINKQYGFHAELARRLRPADADTIFSMVNEVFSYMPLSCLLAKTVLCMHGGISPKLSSLKDILDIPKPIVDPSTNELACDLLWADPMVGLSGFRPNSVRGLSKFFGEDALDNVMRKIGVELIIRGHQVAYSGHRFYHGRKLITLFSAPGYSTKCDNKGAVVRVNSDGRLHFKIFPPTATSLNDDAICEHDLANELDDTHAVAGVAGKNVKGGL
ncbi:hypothetical protein PFISCL1PPCAC_8607, partial [Pristionchus fissidentatus]